MERFFRHVPSGSIKATTNDSAKSRKEEDDPNPWIILIGGRTIASGIGLLGCAELGLDRALGVCLCSSIVASGIDGWVVMWCGLKMLLGDGESASSAERKEVEEVTFRTGLGPWCFLGAFSIMGAWMVYAAERQSLDEHVRQPPRYLGSQDDAQQIYLFDAARVITVRRHLIGLRNVSLPSYMVAVGAEPEGQLPRQDLFPTTHPKVSALPYFHTTTWTSLLKSSNQSDLSSHNTITEHCAASIMSNRAVMKEIMSTTATATAPQSKAAASACMRLVADNGGKATQWAVANPGTTAAVGAGAVLLAAPMAAAALVLGAAGFGANGIVAGSVAAGAQSSIGSVVAPSFFATLQSAGAGGYGIAAVSTVVQSLGAVVASSGVMSMFGKTKPWDL
ncbi:hypothetical protein CHU98_g4385 [Xylaria longipes]|nr:hypothetical protein CHU98_g4385 [Xylaria longipes]